MFEVIDRTIDTASKSLNETIEVNLERNLNILDQLKMKADDAEKSWKKIEQIINMPKLK
ncbi:MAG TPA: hypothetical protein VK169_02110 [Saprospiraceae bacterium]|nr:hypothetical protein [Saprospiraceae bacterium]